MAGLLCSTTGTVTSCISFTNGAVVGLAINDDAGAQYNYHSGGELFDSLSAELQESINQFRTALVGTLTKGEDFPLVTAIRDLCMKGGFSTDKLLAYHEVMYEVSDRYGEAIRKAKASYSTKKGESFGSTNCG